MYPKSDYNPKSDYIPLLYTHCLEAYDSLLEKNPDFQVTKRCPTKHMYWTLFSDPKFNVKCEAIFPQIKFSTVVCNIFSEAIDPSHRDICYLIAQDVVYTNYFLYIHKFASNARLKTKSPRTTSLCSHIFLVLRDHGVYMYVVYI